MTKPSLSDIARIAGVSKTTASFVLNGQGKQRRISDQVIVKVQQTAEAYNYKPNRLARSLRTGSTKFIGVIVVDVASYYFSRLGRAIENSAAKRGYRVMICSSDEKDDLFTEWVDELIDSKVDGLIITPTVHAQNKIMKLQRSAYPFVLIDRDFPGTHADFVGINNTKAAYEATQLIAEKAYDQIGIISFEPALDVFRHRIDGYKQALDDHGIRINPGLIKTVGYHDIQNQVDTHIPAMLNKGVRAILFASARIGMAGLRCLFNMKIRIPEELAVFSFDDNELFSLIPPGISAISQPLDDMGEQAVSLLLQRLKDPDKPYERIILEADVIPRGSI